MTKDELIKIAKPYFAKKIGLIYATADGNFFHENAKNYANNHAKAIKSELFIIVRSDVEDVEKVVNEKVVNELKVEARKPKPRGKKKGR